MKNSPNRLWANTLLSCALLFSGLLIAAPAAQAADRSDAYRQLNLFSDVYARIRSTYVEEVEDKEMIEAAIKRHVDLARPAFKLSEP